MGKLKLWASQQDQLLILVSSTTKSKKWKRASQELKKYGYQRTDVECRQRFVNHLDPSVNKRLWSEEELETLYSKYREYGNKWFLIQKHLPGRTQTKIKNYFYGNIRYLLKLIIKFFFRNSTGFINDIKTETLLNIYESEEEYEGLTLVSKIIKKLRFKVEKEACDRIIEQNKEQFYQFIQYFLQNCKIRPVLNAQQEDSASSSNQDSPNLLVMQCQPVPLFEKPCQTQEGIRQALSAEQLKALAEYHLKCYQMYQQAYRKLVQRQQ